MLPTLIVLPDAWSVAVATTQVSHAAIDFEDRRGESVKHFVVSPLDVTLVSNNIREFKRVPQLKLEQWL